MSAIAFGVMGGLQLAGSYFAAQNARETAKLNRDIADMNAEFAELDAYNAKIEGYGEVARYQKVIDQTLSEQQANLAAADVDVNYGSAAAIQSETQFVTELNKMELVKQAEESALGFKAQARNYRMQGAINYGQGIQQADAMMFQGIMGAAQSGMKGYGAYKRTGTLTGY